MTLIMRRIMQNSRLRIARHKHKADAQCDCGENADNATFGTCDSFGGHSLLSSACHTRQGSIFNRAAGLLACGSLVWAAFPDCSSGISARPSSLTVAGAAKASGPELGHPHLIPISSSHRFAQRKNRAWAIWSLPPPTVKANIDATQAVTVTEARKSQFQRDRTTASEIDVPGGCLEITDANRCLRGGIGAFASSTCHALNGFANDRDYDRSRGQRSNHYRHHIIQLPQFWVSRHQFRLRHTFGQVFTVGSDTVLDRIAFNFCAISGGSLATVLRIFKWNDSTRGRTGSELFASNPITLTDTVATLVSWDVGVELTNGSQYIAYLDTTGLGNTNNRIRVSSAWMTKPIRAETCTGSVTQI